jgi:hypothetical protein
MRASGNSTLVCFFSGVYTIEVHEICTKNQQMKKYCNSLILINLHFAIAIPVECPLTHLGTANPNVCEENANIPNPEMGTSTNF